MNNQILTKIIMIGAVAVCFLSACSSDDDGKDSYSLLGKKLMRIDISDGSNDTWFAGFSYDESGVVSYITTSSGKMMFYYQENSIVLKDYDHDKTSAELENGKIKRWGKSNYKCFYNSNGKLTKIVDGNTSYNLTWQGENILKLECGYKDEIYHSIEFTYTDYDAHMLSYSLFFNPFTEFDAFDTTWSHAFFFTGAFGCLSRKLPKTAILHEGKNTSNRTYYYKMDSSGYPINILIDGEPLGSPHDDPYDYPYNIDVEWE